VRAWVGGDGGPRCKGLKVYKEKELPSERDPEKKQGKERN